MSKNFLVSTNNYVIYAKYTTTKSTTIQFPKDGYIAVMLVGGGGTGGYAFGPPYSTPRTALATGGGAGSISIDYDVKVLAGQTITITIGFSAISSLSTLNFQSYYITNNPFSSINGNNGGQTNLSSDFGYYLTAPGGSGGFASIINATLNNTYSTTMSGGQGGTIGSGGSIRAEFYAGGNGGNIITPYKSSDCLIATGGGAVNYGGLSTPCRGGNVTGSGGSVDVPFYAFTGGAGVFQNGQDTAGNQVTLGGTGSYSILQNQPLYDYFFCRLGGTPNNDGLDGNLYGAGSPGNITGIDKFNTVNFTIERTFTAETLSFIMPYSYNRKFAGTGGSVVGYFPIIESGYSYTGSVDNTLRYILPLGGGGGGKVFAPRGLSTTNDPPFTYDVTTNNSYIPTTQEYLRKAVAGGSGFATIIYYGVR